MTRAEMLSMWFVHDGGSTQDWRLKGHAIGPFWDWVASWARCVSKPSDLGFDDNGFALPPLLARRHIVRLGGRVVDPAVGSLDGDPAALRHRVPRVDAEVQERVLQLGRVRQDGPEPVRPDVPHLDARPDRALDQVEQIGRASCRERV